MSQFDVAEKAKTNNMNMLPIIPTATPQTTKDERQLYKRRAGRPSSAKLFCTPKSGSASDRALLGTGSNTLIAENFLETENIHLYYSHPELEGLHDLKSNDA